jgi:hypothetical protein
MGKSRLAPLKPMTIPRLELSAAALAIRIDGMVRNELELTVKDAIFWTDSMIVLQYIRNEDKRFQVFVANRIAMIHSGSSPSQWRYVDSKLNPADDASRGLPVEDMVKDNRWLKGPDFFVAG